MARVRVLRNGACMAMVGAALLGCRSGNAGDPARISQAQGANAVLVGDSVLLPVVREDCVLVLASIDVRTGRIEKQTAFDKDSFDGWCPEEVETLSAIKRGFVLGGSVSKLSGIVDQEEVDRAMAIRLNTRGQSEKHFGDGGVRRFEDPGIGGPFTLLAGGAVVAPSGVFPDEGSSAPRLSDWANSDPGPLIEPTPDGGAVLVAQNDADRIVVRRLRANGQQDATFGHGGSSRPGPRGQPQSMLLRRDGGLLVRFIPTTRYSISASRELMALSPNGQHERGPEDNAGSEIDDRPLAQAPDGSVVAVSLAEDLASLLAARYSQRGRGLALTRVKLPRKLFPVDSPDFVSGSVVVDRRGEVTAVFAETDSARLAIVHLHRNLRLDREFGHGGVVVLTKI